MADESRSQHEGQAPGTEHLTAGEIADYLDGKLSAAERARAEAHLADCESCGRDAIAASRELATLRRRDRRRVAAPLAAAAVLVGLVFAGPAVWERLGQDETHIRAGEDPGEASRVRVVQPAHRGVLPRDSLLFVWRSVSDGSFYTFTLADEVGDILWQGDTQDTTVSLDREVALRPGQRYFWYVDALFEDGRTASTGVHELVAGR